MYVFTYRKVSKDYYLKKSQRPWQHFRFGLSGVQLILWCGVHHKVSLSGLMHCAKSDSAAWCTLRSHENKVSGKTPRWDAHRRVWLRGIMHTTESVSAMWCTLRFLTPQCDILYTAEFFKNTFEKGVYTDYIEKNWKQFLPLFEDVQSNPI